MGVDDEPIAWDELELDELHELLLEEIPGLSPAETTELAELLRAAGGIDGAIELLHQLAEQQPNRSAA